MAFNNTNCEYFTGTIVYSNIASLMAKYTDLTAYVSHESPTFLALSETWLPAIVPDSLVSLNGYTMFRKDRYSGRGGGVCIYVCVRFS